MNNADEIVEEDEEVCLVLDDFKHFDEICGIIDRLPENISTLNQVEHVQENLKRIFDLYQEQPHLLDPYLSRLLERCLKVIINTKDYLPANAEEEHLNKLRHLAFLVIYLLSKTRGYKILVRLLPHEVADLDPALDMLEKQDPDDGNTWESRYVLLLWLSIVSLIPFDLSRLDAGRLSTTQSAPLMQRVLEQGKLYLMKQDSSQIVAAFLLAHFLSRPDVVREGKLHETIYWACDLLKQQHLQDFLSERTSIALFRLLAFLFKYGKRADLIGYASDPILKSAMQVNVSDMKNILLKKMKCKLLQRLGLIHLSVRVATWRYDRGQRSLADNLLPQTESGDNAQHSAPTDLPSVSNDVLLEKAKESGETEEEYMDISEDVPEVIDYLLDALRDRDTIVRWSAAKGLGRICNRLSQMEVNDVIEACLVLFSRLEPHSAWHGACLALAELGRRGLLLPSRLNDVMPLVMQALFYDERSGECGYGAHVRDAACYVCWAFARAYSPQELLPILKPLADSLVLVTLFDREVNVRRAAAAAFQEHVGRQGQFPHGIDILTSCDYFAVGLRHNAFLELSVFVAQYEDYRVPMLNHLANLKLNHWDPPIRELTAKTIGVLTTFNVSYILGTLFPMLLNHCVGVNVLMRHGSIMACAEIIYALNGQITFTEEIISGISSIIFQLSEKNQFRGITGELMRTAMCQLIRRAAEAKFPVYGLPVINKWRDFLLECLQQNALKVQDCVVAALEPFMRTYLRLADGTLDVKAKEIILNTLLPPVNSTSFEWVQTGCVRGIGTVPDFVWDSEIIPVMLKKLILSSSHTNDPRTEKWGDARRESLNSITRLLTNIGMKHELLTFDVFTALLNAYLHALEDYTVSNRGDIGSRVREASMQQLTKIIPMMVANEVVEPLTSEFMTKVIGKILQQAVEKIDRTRIVACTALIQLLHNEPQIPNIPHFQELLTHFPKHLLSSKSLGSASEAYIILAELLNLEAYRISLIQGFVVSVGGLTETTALNSSRSLIAQLQSNAEDEVFLTGFISDTILLFDRFQRIDRVSFPMLKFWDFLLHDSIIADFLANKDDFLLEILTLTKKEILRSKDVYKIKAAIDVYCAFLQFPGDICTKALRSIMILLGHQFPVIRKSTASKLYESTLINDFVEESKMDKLTELLTETIWENPVEEVRIVRNEISKLLDLPLPEVRSL